jgi:hypothetical protein
MKPAIAAVIALALGPTTALMEHVRVRRPVTKAERKAKDELREKRRLERQRRRNGGGP